MEASKNRDKGCPEYTRWRSENEMPLSFPGEEISLDRGSFPLSPIGRCALPAWSSPYGSLHRTIVDT
jgi:hypothetical protein